MNDKLEIGLKFWQLVGSRLGFLSGAGEAREVFIYTLYRCYVILHTNVSIYRFDIRNVCMNVYMPYVLIIGLDLTYTYVDTSST